MTKFSYRGRDYRGKKSGKITATSRREAVVKLNELGIKVQSVEQIPENVFTKDIGISRKVKLKHFVIFLRQFSTLLKSGITMIDSTRILAEQTDNKHLRNALLDIEQELKEGNPLSYACSKHKKIFSPMFLNMVKAGEVGGNLDEVLDRLAVHFEKQHDMHKKMTAALMYPVMVGLLSIVVTIFLLVAIVPTFVGLFDEFGGELPAVTKFVLKLSAFMQGYWYLILLGVIAFVTVIIILKKNPLTKYYFDVFLLKTPVFGKMLQKAALARFTRTFGSLFASSVPVLQAMTIVEEVVGNEVIAKVIHESRDSLERGQSITIPMIPHWAFPPLVTQMIIIGEETGSLDSMLTKVADFYEKEVEYSSDQMKALIEPVLILSLSLIVGTILMSILIPMFQIFNQVGTY